MSEERQDIKILKVEPPMFPDVGDILQVRLNYQERLLLGWVTIEKVDFDTKSDTIFIQVKDFSSDSEKLDGREDDVVKLVNEYLAEGYENTKLEPLN